MDAFVLELAAAGPVVVAPLASALTDREATGDQALAYYRGLGADEVRVAPTDPVGALAAVRAAGLLVLPGGSPSRLLAALRTGPLGRAVRDLLAAGGVVSGASAGAMVLGAVTVLPEQGVQTAAGLGVVPGVLVVPHWTGERADWLRVAAQADPDLTVLGLPEQSGVLVQDGRLVALGRQPSRLVGSGEDLVPDSAGGPGRSVPVPLATTTRA